MKSLIGQLYNYYRTCCKKLTKRHNETNLKTETNKAYECDQ